MARIIVETDNGFRIEFEVAFVTIEQDWKIRRDGEITKFVVVKGGN